MEKKTTMKCYKKPELEIICTDVQCQTLELSGGHLPTNSGGDFDDSATSTSLFSASESSNVKSSYEGGLW